MKKKYLITLVLMVVALFALFAIQLNEHELPLSPGVEARIPTFTGSVASFAMGVLIVGIMGTFVLMNVDKSEK